MRAYVISTLFNKLFMFGYIFLKIFMHYFKMFGYIIMQTLITVEITEKTIVNIYKIKVFK